MAPKTATRGAAGQTEAAAKGGRHSAASRASPAGGRSRSAGARGTAKTTGQGTGSIGEMVELFWNEEVGHPIKGRGKDKRLYELMSLCIAEDGLNWRLILPHREDFRKALANFDIQKVASFSPDKVDKLLQEAREGKVGLVPNREKVEAYVVNAQKCLKAAEEFGSFAAFVESLLQGKEGEAKEPEALANEMSKALSNRGFVLCTPTACQEFIKAAGLHQEGEE